MWRVGTTPHADEDLERLRRQPKPFQEAVRLIRITLPQDPYVGAELQDELAGIRRVHFYYDRYRMMWKVFPSEKEVHVLCVELKNQSLYNRLFDHWLELQAARERFKIRWHRPKVDKQTRQRGRRRSRR